MEALNYWKCRQVTARDDYELNKTQENYNELSICNQVVKRLETTLFKRKKIK